ncbi:Uncharacterised protein [Vibrio cholerae]|nr:Uncharacterised protein [Vibrio cholerae]
MTHRHRMAHTAVILRGKQESDTEIIQGLARILRAHGKVDPK